MQDFLYRSEHESVVEITVHLACARLCKNFTKSFALLNDRKYEIIIYFKLGMGYPIFKCSIVFVTHKDKFCIIPT